MNERDFSVHLAYRAIILLGIVSLFGDIIYEGSRGLVPDYLGVLGASGIIIGIVGGLGEFIGYSMRLISGFLVDTTKAYWFFIFLGYGLIAAIPFLGISYTWQLAALLVILERLGKAIRTPSRDIILSIVGKKVGTGKTFGIHELLDQTGAILGPMTVAALMLFTQNDYSYTFLALFLPYAMLMLSLFIVYGKIGGKTYEHLRGGLKVQRGGLTRSFFIYTLAVALNTIGLISAMLILYRASEFFDPWIVPLIYLLIQGVDAAVALAAGYAYDRYGTKFLALPFILSTAPSILTVIGSTPLMIIMAASIFGLVLGMQESIYRAAVADLVPLASRGKAYGIFNTLYGVGFLISGTIFGFFIDVKGLEFIAILYTLTAQILALMLLGFIKREMSRPNT